MSTLTLSSQASSFQKEVYANLMKDLQKDNAFYCVKIPVVMNDHNIIQALNDARIEHQRKIATFSTPDMKEAIDYMIQQKIKEHCVRKYKQCIVDKGKYNTDPVLRTLVLAKDNHHLLTLTMRCNALAAYKQVKTKIGQLRKFQSIL